MTRASIGTITALLSHLGTMTCMLLLLIVVLIVLVPTHVGVFANHGMDLPRMTQFAVRCSSWMIHYWFLTVPALALDGIVYFLLAGLSPKLNWLASVWACLVVLGMTLLVGTLAVAICLPLQQLPLGR